MVWPAIAIVILKGLSVGTTQTSFAHGLPSSLFTASGIRVYSIVVGPQAAAGYVSQTIAPDGTNIYLIANAAATICTAWVGPDTV